MVANKAGLSFPRSFTFRTHVCALIPLCVNSRHYSSVLYIRLDEWRLPLSAEQPGCCTFFDLTAAPRKSDLQAETRSTKLKRSGSCPARPNEAGRKSCSFCPVVFLTTMNCMERRKQVLPFTALPCSVCHHALPPGPFSQGTLHRICGLLFQSVSRQAG